MAEMNVVPYIDVMLVLLVIFMITAPLLAQGVKVNLPKAGKPSKLEGPKMQAITIDNQGNVKLNAVSVTLATLESQLGAIKARTPEFPVVVRGDSQTQYQTIMNVLDVLGRLNISQIGLATKPAK